jgi:dihydroflavonol-4-reductase
MLLPGATGILGSHVTLVLLEAGKNVLACRRAGSQTQKARELFRHYGREDLFGTINWTDIDVTDVFSLENTFTPGCVVYHCAGLVSFDSRDRDALYSANVTGTANVVNACLTRGADLLCHVSSAAAIHNLDKRSALDEMVFWKRSGTESDYARSKYSAEREVWRGAAEGLNVVIVNPGVVLSPGFAEQSSSKIFDTCYKGTVFYPDGITGYVAARDVALIMARLVEERKTNDRYILVEGNYSYREIFGAIQRNFSKREPFIPAGNLILRLGWIVDNILSFILRRPPTLTRALIHSAGRKQDYSSRKLLKATGFEFTPTMQVLREICVSYLERRRQTMT